MIFLSLVLVIVAAVTLVLGVFQDGLVLIYVSIATCVAAMAVLGAAVLMRRREEASALPAGYGAGGGGRSAASAPASAAGGATAVRPGRTGTDTEQTPTVREGAGSSAADAAFRRPETDVTTRPAAKRAVAKRTDAATPQAQGAPAKKAAVKKAAVKKAAVKKAAVKKAAVRKATGRAPAASGPAAEPSPASAGSGRSMDDLITVRGLGPAKRDRLLEHFGSVDAIAAASIEELTSLQGIGPGTAAAIKDALA